jgi:hypothetical protein
MWIATLLALSQFFFWSIPIDWQMHQQNVVVRGTVVNAQTGTPVAGAVVRAMSAANLAETKSDSNGNFIFLTLLPGIYRLCASGYDRTADCRDRDSQAEQLFAGFEYGATIVI